MKDQQKVKKHQASRRHRRVRAKISGTNEVPRLAVYRSLGHIYAQLINDDNGQTLVACSDTQLNSSAKLVKDLSAKAATAFAVGQELAQKAVKAGYKKAVFDRGGFKYHGRVKALAEGARAGGLEF